VYRIDVVRIVSKYIGETKKNWSRPNEMRLSCPSDEDVIAVST
jgi:hypothetical protein